MAKRRDTTYHLLRRCQNIGLFTRPSQSTCIAPTLQHCCIAPAIERGSAVFVQQRGRRYATPLTAPSPRRRVQQFNSTCGRVQKHEYENLANRYLGVYLLIMILLKVIKKKYTASFLVSCIFFLLKQIMN